MSMSVDYAGIEPMTDGRFTKDAQAVFLTRLAQIRQREIMSTQQQRVSLGAGRRTTVRTPRHLFDFLWFDYANNLQTSVSDLLRGGAIANNVYVDASRGSLSDISLDTAVRMCQVLEIPFSMLYLALVDAGNGRVRSSVSGLIGFLRTFELLCSSGLSFETIDTIFQQFPHSVAIWYKPSEYAAMTRNICMDIVDDLQTKSLVHASNQPMGITAGRQSSIVASDNRAGSSETKGD